MIIKNELSVLNWVRTSWWHLNVTMFINLFDDHELSRILRYTNKLKRDNKEKHNGQECWLYEDVTPSINSRWHLGLHQLLSRREIVFDVRGRMCLNLKPLRIASAYLDATSALPFSVVACLPGRVCGLRFYPYLILIFFFTSNG